MDSGAAMTIIYKECGHKLRSDEDQMYLAIDNNTDRILMHNRCSSIKKNINIEVVGILIIFYSY